MCIRDRYAVGIPRTAIDALGGDARLRERVARALAASELPAVRRIDGIGKKINVREFLRSIDVAPDASLLDRAGIGGDLVTLAVEVEVRGSGGVKIAEVVEVVFGLSLIHIFPFPDDGPIGGPEAIFDRMSVEIARGCTEGCRFCQAGMIYRPVRERDPEQIVTAVVNAVKKSGYDEASLTSLSTADYSCVAPLVKKVADALAPQRVSLGVSS